MNEDPEADSGSIPATDSWLEVLGVRFPRGQGTGPVNAAPGAPAPAPEPTPTATDTDFFFDHDSSALTDSDKQSLDRYVADLYVKALLAEKTDPIVVEAYASTDGDPGHNKRLSDARAKAVADYLVKNGVPRNRITARGNGPTENFPGGLSHNRRATLKPKPSGTPSTPGPSPTTPPPSQGEGTMRMRKDPLDKDGAVQRVVDKTPPKKTPDDVPLAEVEEAMKKFFEKLGESQRKKTKSKGTTVKSTDKVWQVDKILHENLGPGSALYTKKGGDGQDYEPADLARKIAQTLPDRVPRANYEKFLKLKPEDSQLEGTITEQLNKKYHELRDKIANAVPGGKKVQDLVRKGIDLLMEKGTSFSTDEFVKGLDVGDDAKKEIKKAIEDFRKKVTEDKP